MPISRQPILPQRLRRIDGQSFAFIPHRFMREGFFSSLLPDQLRLYVFLVLVADRDGMSFYHFERICSVLELPIEQFLEARDALLDKDLIATDGARMQVLSLPSSPVLRQSRALRTPQQLEDEDPATIRKLVRDSFDNAALAPRK